MVDLRYDGVRYKTGRDALTEAEVRTVISSALSLETVALLSLAIAGGLRREDVVSVEVANIRRLEAETGVGLPRTTLLEVAFWEKKRRRNWRVFVTGSAAQGLLLYLNQRRRDKSRWLFPSPRTTSKHISSRHAYDMLQSALEAAGLKRRPFHALRATCMKMCQRKGWTIEQTMELTGDSWRTVQEHYLTPSEDELRETALMKPLVMDNTYGPDGKKAVPDQLRIALTERPLL